MNPTTPANRATATLLVLTAINFVNYVDRFVLSAVLEDVRLELGFDDVRGGFLGTAFIVVYTAVAPIAGWFGDHVVRKRMVCASVLLWSLATAGSAVARDYETLLVTRALVGVGEAAWATVAPTMIADLFAPSRLGRRLATFYLATPVGSALGYVLGGVVGESLGWRAAFAVAGLPGVLLALMVISLPEPERGAFEREPAPSTPLSQRFRTIVERVTTNRAFWLNTVATTFFTFTIGGLAFWAPTYLMRAHHLSLRAANLGFGATTVLAGLLGTLIGGHLGDRAERRAPGGYFRVSGVGLLVAAPLVALVPALEHDGAVFAAIFAAELMLFLNTGPLNAAMAACVPAHVRAGAFALYVFFMHAFGDAISPALIGWTSETAGLGTALGLTAIPVGIGGLILIVGQRYVSNLTS